MKSAVLTCNPAPVGGRPPVASVDHSDLIAALNPLLTLLGTWAGAILVGSLELGSDYVRFMSCEPVEGVEPVKWGDYDVAELRQRWARGEEPDGAVAIWAWPVEVKIVLP